MLDINMKFKRGVLVIKLKGSLTVNTSYILENNFSDIMKKSDLKYVLLDLNNIKNIDKEGILAVKKCYYRVLKNGGKFMIYGMDTVFKEDTKNNFNLYQIKEEKIAYKIANI